MRKPKNRRWRERREQAVTRQAIRDERSDVGQIGRLIHYGHGHCREVKRLRARLEKAS